MRQLNLIAFRAGLKPLEREVLGLLIRRQHISAPQIMIHLYAGKPDCEHPENETAAMIVQRLSRKISAKFGTSIEVTDCGWRLPKIEAERLMQQ